MLHDSLSLFWSQIAQRALNVNLPSVKLFAKDLIAWRVGTPLKSTKWFDHKCLCLVKCISKMDEKCSMLGSLFCAEQERCILCLRVDHLRCWHKARTIQVWCWYCFGASHFFEWLWSTCGWIASTTVAFPASLAWRHEGVVPCGSSFVGVARPQSRQYRWWIQSLKAAKCSKQLLGAIWAMLGCESQK